MMRSQDRPQTPIVRSFLVLLTVAVGLLLGGCSGGAGDSDSGTEQSAEGPRLARPDAIDAAGLRRQDAETLPNIVFILIDTLRADRLGSYGHPGNLSPNMDKLASEGIRFARAQSPAPWTLPSIASIMTGYQATVHKANSFRKIDQMDRGALGTVAMLDESFVTLPETLKEAGYETAGFVANKFIKRKYGMAQGFDHYDTEFAANTVEGRRLNERAISWLEQRESDKPFFLYMHYMDVHGPYDAAPQYLDQVMKPLEAKKPSELTQLDQQAYGRINAYLRKPPKKPADPTRWNRMRGFREYWEARYDAGVLEMDAFLGELFTKLQEMGIYEDAYIVLTSDHGEALGRRGWWDHGYSQFQSDISVPLIIRWNGKIPAGRVAPDTASLMGIAPTMYEQLQLPFDQNIQGESLVGHMASSSTINDFAISEAIKVGAKQLAVVRGKWKLIAMQHPQTGSMGFALFDLDDDPDETRNIASQFPDKRKALSEELVRFVQQSNRLKPGITQRRAPVDEAEMKRLEGLGYTGEGDEEDE